MNLGRYAMHSINSEAIISDPASYTIGIIEETLKENDQLRKDLIADMSRKEGEKLIEIPAPLNIHTALLRLDDYEFDLNEKLAIKYRNQYSKPRLGL